MALIILGSQVLWIAVPVGGLWLASLLTDSFGWHMPVALTLILPGMFLTGLGLAWLNELYLRINRAGTAIGSGGLRRARGGPLELILAISFLVALAALFVWFFLFAENPAPRGILG